MDLKNFTDEQLKAELRKRMDERKVSKESQKRCRNCKHFGVSPMGVGNVCLHPERRYIAKGVEHFYNIKPYSKCDKHERI